MVEKRKRKQIVRFCLDLSEARIVLFHTRNGGVVGEGRGKLSPSPFND